VGLGGIEPPTSALSELNKGLLDEPRPRLSCLFVTVGASRRRPMPLRLGTLWARQASRRRPSSRLARLRPHKEKGSRDRQSLGSQRPSSIDITAGWRPRCRCAGSGAGRLGLCRPGGGGPAGSAPGGPRPRSSSGWRPAPRNWPPLRRPARSHRPTEQIGNGNGHRTGLSSWIVGARAGPTGRFGASNDLVAPTYRGRPGSRGTRRLSENRSAAEARSGPDAG